MSHQIVGILGEVDEGRDQRDRDEKVAMRDQLVAFLQANGGMSNLELAKRVGLTPAKTARIINAFPLYFSVDRNLERTLVMVDVHPHLAVRS